MRLSELAERLGLAVLGEGDPEIRGIAHPSEATGRDLVFVDRSTFTEAARTSGAAGFLVSAEISLQDPRPCLRTKQPALDFIRVLSLFEPDRRIAPGIHSSVLVGEGCQIEDSATILAGTVIGHDVSIGAGVVIGAHCVIGDGVSIGARTVLKPRVTVGDACVIGSDCILQSGAVIGSDGFGYLDQDGKRYRVPHLGRVVLESEVEVGANTTIDRAVVGSTLVGRGTKIDNLVQIAHNCRIGRMCYLVAQAGIGGSAVIGNGVTVAGQVGISDHVRVGDGATIVGKSAVREPVSAGRVVGGIPARPIRLQNQIHDALVRLPEWESRLSRLEGDSRPPASRGDRPLREEVTSLLARQLEVPEAEIQPDIDLKEHFGADSLTVLTLITELETRFEIGIPDQHVRNLRTPRQIVEYLESRV